jgi:hypothetical protein
MNITHATKAYRCCEIADRDRFSNRHFPTIAFTAACLCMCSCCSVATRSLSSD